MNDANSESAASASETSWDIAAGLTYLNHGSFGLSPRVVNVRCAQLSAELKANPMEFFIRRQEKLLAEATIALAEFVGCAEENLVMVDNATVGMNVVAANFPLAAGDQVLLTNHEYGAVARIWQRACDRVGAKLATVEIPFPPRSDEDIVNRIAAAVTSRTRLLVVSHVASATATIFPVAEICEEMRGRGIAICVDGPHAIAQIPLNVAQLDCDYYTASCHKWLCGPLGAGFLYARTPDEPRLEPLVQSWGRVQPTLPRTWRDEFWWSGTRDLAPYLAVPTAIEFMRSTGLDAFRRKTHSLALFARERISRAIGLDPFLPERDDWFGSMVPLPMHDCDTLALQKELAERYRIEVPLYRWREQPIIRVSCHLYNDREQIEYLAESLEELLG